MKVPRPIEDQSVSPSGPSWQELVLGTFWRFFRWNLWSLRSLDTNAIEHSKSMLERLFCAKDPKSINIRDFWTVIQILCFNISQEVLGAYGIDATSCYCTSTVEIILSTSAAALNCELYIIFIRCIVYALPGLRTVLKFKVSCPFVAFLVVLDSSCLSVIRHVRTPSVASQTK